MSYTEIFHYPGTVNGVRIDQSMIDAGLTPDYEYMVEVTDGTRWFRWVDSVYPGFDAAVEMLEAGLPDRSWKFH